MNENIVSIKLISGEEIIARVANQEGEYYELKDARVLFMTPNGELKLAPVMFSHDLAHTITVYKSSVASISYHPKADFAKAYEETLSPLVLPNRRIITE